MMVVMIEQHNRLPRTSLAIGLSDLGKAKYGAISIVELERTKARYRHQIYLNAQKVTRKTSLVKTAKEQLLLQHLVLQSVSTCSSPFAQLVQHMPKRTRMLGLFFKSAWLFI